MKAKVEIKEYQTEEGTVCKAIWVDDTPFDWYIDPSYIIGAAVRSNQSEFVKKGVEGSLQNHFTKSFSEFMGREISLGEIVLALRDGQIEKQPFRNPVVSEDDGRFYTKDTGGLFATADLKEGDFFEVVGTLIGRGTAADKCTKSVRRFTTKPDNTFKYLLIPAGWGNVIRVTKKGQTPNAQIVYDEESSSCAVAIILLRDIKKDEEVLVS